jgi:chromosome transmission fidelity protein 18
MALELIPYTLRMLSPDVKPVIVNTGPAGSKSNATAAVRKSSEKALVKKAVEAMAATGVRFERSRVEVEDAMYRSGGFVFRMEPPLDTLASFETLADKKDDKVRYAVRSVLEMEWKKESARIDMENRKRRGGQETEEVVVLEETEEDVAKKLDEANKKASKRDFFGRIIKEKPHVEGEIRKTRQEGDDDRIWVSFHEGFSNAVRKPITIDELFRGL